MTTTTTTATPPSCIRAGLGDGPAVYIACLASYNNGTLYGAWLNLSECTDADDIQEGIGWILSHSPAPGAEEWAMHDHQDLPGFLTRSEWPCWADVIEYLDILDGIRCDDEASAYRYLCDDAGQVLSRDQVAEQYLGTYSSEEDFARETAEEQGLDVDHPLSCYIDWSNVWRGEYDCNGYNSHPAGGGNVHIFCPS